ncbi:hypothetical protein J2Y48_002484 [Mycoplana sp. BE70]|uniref:hypothetical protein n=1 Tax=Mycoplana sp. BE70 TaxID=2817775 RepID=UPI0028678062|nr:hypothetical protein [Mycoplana sp. BE70]MDR6757188.1 hypothetical protein [Mycoplana sp. BE70]
MNTINLDDIFTNLNITVQALPSRLDPLADLQRSNMRVDYSPRFGKTAVPFMDFSKGDRRWLDHLIEELAMIADVYPADKVIMLGYSTAKRGTGGKQTWQQYVDGLYVDKVLPRKDYSESQLKHLPVLIDQLRGGKRLAGCGTLEFRNITNGKTL